MAEPAVPPAGIELIHDEEVRRYRCQASLAAGPSLPLPKSRPSPLLRVLASWRRCVNVGSVVPQPLTGLGSEEAKACLPVAGTWGVGGRK